MKNDKEKLNVPFSKPKTLHELLKQGSGHNLVLDFSMLSKRGNLIEKAKKYQNINNPKISSEVINNEKTERNKSIFQFFGSIVFGGIGGAAAHLSKDMKDKIEYASSSLFNFINSGLNGVDIYKAVKNINELEKAEKEAIDLRKDIEKEIDKLKERFESLKTAHIPNFD